MVKPFKDFLPWNQWNNFNETWYVASGTTTHPNLLKILPWVDLDLFFGIVKFRNSGFYKEKNVTVMDYLEIFAAFDMEIGWYILKRKSFAILTKMQVLFFRPNYSLSDNAIDKSLYLPCIQH